MFKDFGVLESIKYSTVNDACEELYNRGGDTRSLSSDIAWDTKTKRADPETSKERAQVLLIDEVDVFFKDDFYGKTFRSVASLQHESIEELLKLIWKNRDSLDESSLSETLNALACLKLFPTDIQPIISQHINSMLNDAQNVDSHDYIVHDGKVCYKEFDGLCTNWVFGYLTTFVAIKEHENGRVTQKAMEHRQVVYLKCGQSSYAEIPTTFDAILGVTGTLKSLGPEERNILKHQYGINKMTYIPSVYGKNKLLFAGDNPRGEYEYFSYE